MLIRYLVAFLPTFHPWSAVLCISALCVSFCCLLCQLPSAWVRTIKGTMKRLGRRGEDWVLAYCHLASGSVLNEQCTSSMYPVHGRFSFCGCSFHLLPSWHHTSFLSLHIRDNLTSRCDSWTGFLVMYGCESWTIKKTEYQRIDTFQLWCWRRHLRVPWTLRRSN